MTPFIKLTWKNQNFEWRAEQQKAFDSIKALFTNKNNLQSHNPEKKLTVKILKDENILQKHNPNKKQMMKMNALQ